MIEKLGNLIHNQSCSHDFFCFNFIYHIIIIVEDRYITIETKEVTRSYLSTHAEKETRYIQYGPLPLFQ